MGMEVPGKRRRGRPKRRWLDSIRNDLSERGLSEEDAQDRPMYIFHINVDYTYCVPVPNDRYISADR